MSDDFSESRWVAGNIDVFEAVRDAGASGRAAVLMNVSTPIASLSSLQLPPLQENRMMRRAWELLLTRLPATVVGKRMSWRSFVLLLEEPSEAARERARDALNALAEDADLGRLAWRILLAPVGPDWK